MGLLKIEEAINTWIVSDDVDEFLSIIKRLPKHKRSMLQDFALTLDTGADEFDNVVELKRVANE